MLSPSEINQFVERGYVVQRGALSPQITAEWLDWCFQRLECGPESRPDRLEPLTRLPGLLEVDGRELCPAGWKAVCQLIGGEDRSKDGWSFTDCFHVNSHIGIEEPWRVPTIASGEWHIDGDLHRRFLDSAEWALVALITLTSSPHNGGATLVAENSVAPVAHYLLEHTEGIDGFNWGTLLEGVPCQFAQVETQPGDILFLHPYLIHSSSPNSFRTPPRHDRQTVRPEGPALLRPLGRNGLQSGGAMRVARAVVRTHHLCKIPTLSAAYSRASRICAANCRCRTLAATTIRDDFFVSVQAFSSRTGAAINRQRWRKAMGTTWRFFPGLLKRRT